MTCRQRRVAALPDLGETCASDKQGRRADGYRPARSGLCCRALWRTLADVAADDAVYQVVRAAFEDHSVLVFRGQDVTDDAQIAFSRRFGPLEITPPTTPGAGTHLVILTTMDKDGKVVPADHRIALRNKANQLWHTDSTFKSVPALASVLSARIIPEHGGETEYVSTRLAWDGSIRRRKRGSQICLLGTTIPIRGARSRRISSVPRSARRCRRNAGGWSGRIRRTGGTRSTSPRTLTRSRAWKTAPRKSSLPS